MPSPPTWHSRSAHLPVAHDVEHREMKSKTHAPARPGAAQSPDLDRVLSAPPSLGTAHCSPVMAQSWPICHGSRTMPNPPTYYTIAIRRVALTRHSSLANRQSCRARIQTPSCIVYRLVSSTDLLKIIGYSTALDKRLIDMHYIACPLPAPAPAAAPHRPCQDQVTETRPTRPLAPENAGNHTTVALPLCPSG
jgi:hypothetical protein